MNHPRLQLRVAHPGEILVQIGGMRVQHEAQRPADGSVVGQAHAQFVEILPQRDGWKQVVIAVESIGCRLAPQADLVGKTFVVPQHRNVLGEYVFGKRKPGRLFHHRPAGQTC